MLLGDYCYVGKTVDGVDYYAAVIDGKIVWTTKRSERLRLSRREDAGKIESLLPDAQFVVEVDRG